jgi:putative ABC transport system permease protein
MEVKVTVILRQVRADIRSHRLQSALIVVSLSAAAVLMTTALSTFRTAQGCYDRLFQRTHGAHLWLELDPSLVPPEEAEQVLAHLAHVEATTGATSYLFARLSIEGKLEEIRLGEWPDEPVSVERPLLMAGHPPQPGVTGRIVLDRNMANELDLDVGDTVDLLTPSGWQPLTVSGLFVTSRYPPYPAYSPALTYVASGSRAGLGLDPPLDPEMQELVIGLRLRDPVHLEAVLQAAERSLPAKSITSRYDWQDTRRITETNILPQRILLTVFSVVASLAAGFLVTNAIAGAVRAQTRQIGLLKAVGFTRGQLALVYLVEYLGLAMVASLAGLAIGSLLAPVLLRPLTAQFGEALAWPPAWAVLMIPLTTLLITALFILWPVRGAVRLDAVQAVRMGADPPRGRTGRLPRLSLSLALGLGDVLSRPLRSALTALGLGTAVFALVAVLALSTTLQTLLTDPAMGYAIDGDLDVVRPHYLDEAEASQLIAGQADVAAYYAQRWYGFSLPGEDKPLYAILREGDLEAFRFPIVEGRMFRGYDEAVVGYGLVREWDLHLGDTLTIPLDGQQLAFRIVGTCRIGSQGGRMLILPLEAVRRAKPEVEPFRWILKLRPDADVEAVAMALTSTSNGLLEIDGLGEEDFPQWLALLQGVLVALSVVLGGLALVAVFNTVWMGIHERQQEFGLLKAVGMTPRQVTLSVLAGAAGISVVGYIVGLLAGLAAIYLVMDAVARGLGYGPLSPSVDGVQAALLLPGVVLLAVAGAFLPARRAGQTTVIDTLRDRW